MTTTLLMQQARTAIREGRLVDARRSLRQLIRTDPTNHAAWLLLAQATPDEKLAAEYVNRAYYLRPDSPLVKSAKDALEADKRTTGKQPILNWRAALPLIGLALILGLLASIFSQGALLERLPLQNSYVENIVAAAESSQEEPGQFVLSRSAELPAGRAEQMESPPESTGPSASQASASSDNVHGNSGEVQATVFQPIVIAGSQPSLPAAIMHGIESEVSSSKNEDANTAIDENSPPPTEEETSETPVAEASGALESSSEDAPEVAASIDGETIEQEVLELAQRETEASIAPEEAAAPNNMATESYGEHWIDVNLTTQTLIAYEGDTPVLHSLISSGLWQFPTVTGQFRTWIKYESQDMTGYHLGYNYELDDVPYVMYFFEDYAIHGAYWHNNFGTPMSHGCVNMNVIDAEWLFNWAPLGTVVSVHY